MTFNEFQRAAADAAQYPCARTQDEFEKDYLHRKLESATRRLLETRANHDGAWAQARLHERDTMAKQLGEVLFLAARLADVYEVPLVVAAHRGIEK